MNWTIQCSLEMGLANVPWEWDYPMCPGNWTIQCAWEWDKPMCPGNGTSQCALGMELSNVPWEWDYPMYAEKELANVPRE